MTPRVFTPWAEGWAERNGSRFPVEGLAEIAAECYVAGMRRAAEICADAELEKNAAAGQESGRSGPGGDEVGPLPAPSAAEVHLALEVDRLRTASAGLRARLEASLPEEIMEWRRMARNHLEQWEGQATYGLTFGQMKEMLVRADKLFDLILKEQEHV